MRRWIAVVVLLIVAGITVGISFYKPNPFTQAYGTLTFPPGVEVPDTEKAFFLVIDTLPSRYCAEQQSVFILPLGAFITDIISMSPRSDPPAISWAQRVEVSRYPEVLLPRNIVSLIQVPIISRVQEEALFQGTVTWFIQATPSYKAVLMALHRSKDYEQALSADL
ncbi:MAG: hypothetical protein WCV85_00100 [Patescibacteria group bacterium]|jgi:hypothetical protein